MTPTPPSATASDNSPDFRVVRKRNRVPLSCAPCRNRKLKCNRLSPCDNCTKRGDAGSCTYAAPSTKRKGTKNNDNKNVGEQTPDDMQNRIDRLEGLVLSLMTNGSSAPGPAAAGEALSAGGSSGMPSGSLGPDLDNELDGNDDMHDDDDDDNESETENVTKSFGILKVDQDNKKTFYVGEAHWAALLNEIGEVKNYFVAHRTEYEAQMEKVAQSRREMGTDVGSGPALLFGATIPPSRNEILAQIPSRYMSDILIGRYFNTFDPATHILHGPTFQRQYNAHWADSSRTSIVWVAMLFAMMRLAMLSYGREGDEPPEFRGKCQDLAANYRTQMAHCLITADYTKPHNHIIETLIFHLHAEYTSNRDAEASVWVLVGMIARLAMRMGYHRDPKHFPNLTPFQGEMRRRIWTFVRSADLLFSFQVALPSMIRIGDSDTELPSNLFDDEFEEESKTLPISRPNNEATPISYMVAKGRLAYGFGRVLEETTSVHRRGYDEVLKIDKGLRDIYDAIPDYLKLKPMREMSLAPISLIMARFSLATIYHKSQVVLHRRYIRQARGNNRYMYSRRTCLDSALQLLSFQMTQHQASQERGRLRSVRSHVNSLTTHDFLLAASVVVMDLYNQRDARPEANGNDVSTPSTTVSGSGSISQGSNASAPSPAEAPYCAGMTCTKDDLLRALEGSQKVWVASRDYSMEAYKASELLGVLLQQLRLPSQSQPAPPQQSSNMQPSPYQQQANSNDDERSAAMGLGMLQQQQQQQQAQAQQQPILQNANQFWPGDAKNMSNIFPSNPDTPGFGGSFMPTSGNSPFPNNIFDGAWAQGGDGSNMNVDWEAFDQAFQMSNVNMDPAANPWSIQNPNSPSNNIFGQTTTSSPDSSSNNQDSSSFGMPTNSSTSGTTNFYGQNISNPALGNGGGGPMNFSFDTGTMDYNGISRSSSTGVGTDSMGPVLSETDTNSGGDGGQSAGEVFMGVQSPVPGGYTGWKWK
ncbi:putative transcriptional regulatory protein [Cyphellophora attinorum]|uniref:Putative transcriptional regulatory protein n=1 Tax=Cyphellophora attinorum TaxID=1664694 RepID=A0A0N1P2A7_9EURO|nr:putative transcriptional regulatory protein [Phialophora attinorum]KPI45212.1 putative transcriptional regulatory protein [Phialophora attinorum]